MHADPYMNAAIAYFAANDLQRAPEHVEFLAAMVEFRAAVDATITWIRTVDAEFRRTGDAGRPLTDGPVQMDTLPAGESATVVLRMRDDGSRETTIMPKITEAGEDHG
jgi:hypothetical protein